MSVSSEPDWWTCAKAEIDNIVEDFVDKLRKNLAEVNPKLIINRKNPFLFCMRNISDSKTLSKMVVDAHLSSSEETKFGGILENIAITICKHAKNGRKSSTEGIDLEYNDDTNNTRTIVQIKSGPNWGNASQHKALELSFKKAQRVLRQGGSGGGENNTSNNLLNIRCIEGCCYGKSTLKDKGSHIQMIGSVFWEEISGWRGTADAVLAILGKHASNGLDEARKTAYLHMEEYLVKRGIVMGNDENQICWDKWLAVDESP